MILIDTTPLVALCDARDSRHRVALRDLNALAPARLVVCEAVLMEACFLLPRGAQRRRLRAALDQLHVAAVSRADDHSFWLDVLDWLAKYADHEPDWADGCLAVLSGRDASLKVWTYDREFRTTWRRPDGTAIPMAVSGR
ncbi:MAG: type II toxin-antitoxin system VapC family toxin [Acidobacteria bacterium]|nr:type II toxin-antitoxin system VapC family toxin [Acidobacteriota bacterium]